MCKGCLAGDGNRVGMLGIGRGEQPFPGPIATRTARYLSRYLSIAVSISSRIYLWGGLYLHRLAYRVYGKLLGVQGRVSLYRDT